MQCDASIYLDVHHVILREDGGTHDLETLILLCGVHHRAQHSGRLQIGGTASAGFTFCHADGSFYGDLAASTTAIEARTDAFRALRHMGFKETESRHAIDTAARTHVGANVETLLRAALQTLHAARTGEGKLAG